MSKPNIERKEQKISTFILSITQICKNKVFMFKITTIRLTISSPLVSFVHNFNILAFSSITVLIILQHSLGSIKSVPFDERFSHESKQFKLRWAAASIISPAIIFKRLSICSANIISGQCSSRIKFCNASNFHNNSLEVTGIQLVIPIDVGFVAACVAALAAAVAAAIKPPVRLATFAALAAPTAAALTNEPTLPKAPTVSKADAANPVVVVPVVLDESKLFVLF
ncbi:unnamed protein product [Schistosoma curassoni]|uniref:Uncharacterized protein n=1 Tax=Schistosoma curassoni TaxID=6186 RepID=A0A183JEV0_9TREM|nr:unnamed protein product [Schistosoma curassoni]